MDSLENESKETLSLKRKNSNEKTDDLQSYKHARQPKYMIPPPPPFMHTAAGLQINTAQSLSNFSLNNFASLMNGSQAQQFVPNFNMNSPPMDSQFSQYSQMTAQINRARGYPIAGLPFYNKDN